MERRGRPRHPDVLTPREFEVLALLRERLTNEQIAERLRVTPATAKYHVSEIITKLGVTSRQEAARWQPEAETRPAWVVALPTALLRRLHALTPAAGGVIVIAVVAAIGVLAWGVVSARGNDAPHWTTTGAPGDRPSVLVFDLSKKSIERLPVSANAGFGAWVKDGETFVAQGDSVSDYGLFNAGGQKILSPTTQDKLTRDVVPAPDGNSLLVGRVDDQYVISGLPIGGGGGFLVSARELQFSPDGQHVAYLSLSQLDMDNNPREGRPQSPARRAVCKGTAGAAWP